MPASSAALAASDSSVATSSRALTIHCTSSGARTASRLALMRATGW